MGRWMLRKSLLIKDFRPVTNGPIRSKAFHWCLARPVDLEDAGLRVRKDPDPVAAPFSGAVGAPTSFRACHHSIPLGDGPHDLREGSIAERRRLRQKEVSQARGILPEIGSETSRWFSRPPQSFAVFETAATWRCFSASPLPIRRCESDIEVLVQGNAASACGTRVPQVAGQLGVGPRPADRRCRSGSPGRGRERPGPSGCLLRHRVGSACASPCRPPRRVAPGPSVPCGKAMGSAATDAP